MFVHPGGGILCLCPKNFPEGVTPMDSWGICQNVGQGYHIGLMPGDPFGDNEYISN